MYCYHSFNVKFKGCAKNNQEVSVENKRSIFMLILLLLFGTNAIAYDFEVNGICYNIISKPDLQVEVTFKGESWLSKKPCYSGSIVIPESVEYQNQIYSVTSIGHGAFKNDVELISVSIPYSIKEINGSAFSGCSMLTDINIPNSIETIELNAFQDCSNLINIKIPNSVSRIRSYAFADCSKLADLCIPYTVKRIDEKAFKDCASLTSITVEAKTPPNAENGSFSGCYSATLYVLKGTLAAYQSADEWFRFTDIQEFDPTGISLPILDETEGNTPIYNLQGTQLKEDKESLPAGVYIQGGKKVIVR